MKPAAPRPLALATRAAHAGSEARGSGHVVAPLVPSSTFARDPGYELLLGVDYARDATPAFGHAERALCDLEGGAEALLFSSGMAAACAVFETLERGERAVVPRVMYWGLRRHLRQRAARWGVEIVEVDTWDDAALAAAIDDKTRLVWIETPANPTWEVSDIARAAALAHRVGAALCVDSTVATPIHTRPIEHGADLVMHSATKYLNGHSDLVAGALVTAKKDARWAAIREHRHDTGPILGAFEAWLLVRGMRTLAVRVERQSRSALTLAEALEGHARVERVLYPGLPSHPQHRVAATQMQGGFGGMLSVLVRGGRAEALAVASRLRLFVRATSLGGTESLVEHRATVEGPGSPAPESLLRLSIGLEDPADLIADLFQALDG